MTLIECLLAQANKEPNEPADLLEEAAQVLSVPDRKPLFADLVAQHPGLAEELVEMDTSQQEPIGTYESITDIMLQLRNGTISDQQVYEVMKDKPLYSSAQKK